MRVMCFVGSVVLVITMFHHLSATCAAFNCSVNTAAVLGIVWKTSDLKKLEKHWKCSDKVFVK